MENKIRDFCFPVRRASRLSGVGSRSWLVTSQKPGFWEKPGFLTMVLYAPKEAKYNDVVQVLDFLRELGGSRVALATLPGVSRSGEDNPSNAPNSGNAPINPNLGTTVESDRYQLPSPPQ